MLDLKPNSQFCEPLGLSPAGNGHVLEKFSSSPLPTLVSREGPADFGVAREISLENPVVGNFGASTLMFGTLLRDMPLRPGEPHRFSVMESQPVETLLFDVLIAPGLIGDAKPNGKAVMGFRDKHRSQPVELLGDFHPEFLGKGYRSLATPEIPGYTDMIEAVESKVRWKIEGFHAWRIWVEFPLFQSDNNNAMGRVRWLN